MCICRRPRNLSTSDRPFPFLCRYVALSPCPLSTGRCWLEARKHETRTTVICNDRKVYVSALPLVREARKRGASVQRRVILLVYYAKLNGGNIHYFQNSTKECICCFYIKLVCKKFICVIACSMVGR